MKDIMSDSGGFSSIKVSAMGGDSSSYIWTTEKIDKLIHDINNGSKDIRKLKNSPFKDNDINLKREKLQFEYTSFEITELEKCKSSLLYFIINYCIIQTHDGRMLVKDIGGLRDFQEQILHTFNNNSLNILMAARQTGKCLSMTSLVDTKHSNGSIETLPFFELYYRIIKTQRKLNILEKIKYRLYKIYQLCQDAKNV